jgi:hypothetical protein
MVVMAAGAAAALALAPMTPVIQFAADREELAAVVAAGALTYRARPLQTGVVLKEGVAVVVADLAMAPLPSVDPI